jgi:hypothetical protein
MRSWRRFRRKWRRWSTPQRMAFVLAVTLGPLLVLSASKATYHAPAQTTAADAPASAQAWSQAFLSAIPEPQTPCNVAAVDAWQQAEGGGVTNAASYNPLDTTQAEPGSWGINGDNVQAYPSWSEGLNANVTAITNGLYGGILSALQAGNSAQAVADSVTASPWGTGVFSASC